MKSLIGPDVTRRTFLVSSSTAVAATMVPGAAHGASAAAAPSMTATSIEVNGKTHQLELDTRVTLLDACLLYTSPSPRDQRGSRMPSSA